jgi:sulfate/thiosulfate transport system permease protein
MRDGGGAPWGRWGVRAAAFAYLFLLLLLPLGVILQDGLQAGLGGLWRAVSGPVARHAIGLTLWTAGVMAAVNAVMGVVTAHVLVRYEFPGKPFLNAVVDLPLAIPTLVTGVMLVVLYGPQAAVGGWLEATLGFRVIFAPTGIVLALLFITLPFVVRAVQPVLQDLDRQQEEVAETLGASPWAVFRKVALPALALPLSSGVLLSFARAVGEFGSIVIVAGNIPLRTQTAAVYVLGEIESDNQIGASAMSVVLLAIAFSVMLAVDLLQRFRRRRQL